jgi:hypothetical protein
MPAVAQRPVESGRVVGEDVIGDQGLQLVVGQPLHEGAKAATRSAPEMQGIDIFNFILKWFPWLVSTPWIYCFYICIFSSLFH